MDDVQKDPKDQLNLIQNQLDHHTMNNKKKNIRRVSGFSLIELLTVISIMSILATISFPGIKMAMMSGQMARATSDARGICIGLRAWANDNDGLFPVGEDEEENEIATSNDAFRLLIPDYIDTERVFANGRSARGRVADNRFEELEDTLEAGENHYAYVAGLTHTSRSNWPLVVDGTNGSGGYVKEQGSKGGCWEGRKAIVAFVGGNVSAIKLKGERDGERFIPRDGYPDENMLDLEAYMGENAELLEPEEGE